LIVLGILALAAVLFGLGMRLYWGLAAPRVAGFFPMMGRAWDMHGGMYFGGFPFLGSLLGIGLLVLVVIGIVGLVRGFGPNMPERTCAHCGYPLKAGWVACPRCGEKV
jgi:hypothetical protein